MVADQHVSVNDQVLLMFELKWKHDFSKVIVVLMWSLTNACRSATSCFYIQSTVHTPHTNVIVFTQWLVQFKESGLLQPSLSLCTSLTSLNLNSPTGDSWCPAVTLWHTYSQSLISPRKHTHSHTHTHQRTHRHTCADPETCPRLKDVSETGGRRWASLSRAPVYRGQWKQRRRNMDVSVTPALTLTGSLCLSLSLSYTHTHSRTDQHKGQRSWCFGLFPWFHWLLSQNRGWQVPTDW